MLFLRINQQTEIIMTKEQFDHFIDGVVGLEDIFPTNNQYPYETLMKMVGQPAETYEYLQLAPGDQFCINPDGSAQVTRADGHLERFFPESGWMSIKINV
jgi:hypothetical protein